MPADVLLEVGPFLGHFGGDVDLGVEVADALFRLVAHPLAVMAHVLGEALRAFPFAHKELVIPAQAGIQFVLWIPGLRCAAPGMTAEGNRRLAGKARRDLDHRLVDQHRHRVEVAGVTFQPQALCFQRQRAAAGKGVVEGRQHMTVEQFPGARMIGVLGAGVAPALPDFVARRLQHGFVNGVLPQHQLLDDAEQPLPLLFLLLLGREQVGMRRRVIDHLRKDHRPRRRQRPPRPPQVQGARMPVSDRLLARCRLVDGFERQGDFDEFLLGHDQIRLTG